MAEAPGDKASAVESVYASLRERILSGEYEPGLRLVLQRVAEEHGVSFIPVREALRLLEGERLVVTEANRGASVAPISLADMRDIYATRIVVEGHALRSALPHLDAAALEPAETALSELSGSLAGGREQDAYRHHRAFHLALYGASGSPWTLHLVEQLWASAERYLRLAPGLRPTPDAFVDEHARVLGAVRSGREREAVDLLTENLRTTASLLEAKGDVPGA
jgi:DNA-binding GntR family transcriptional regulator